MIGLIIFVTYHTEENLKTEAIKTNNGWGYTITNNDKIIIKQTIIPVISNSKSFETKEDALAVGELVMQKLNADSSPTITKNDLILLKIKF